MTAERKNEWNAFWDSAFKVVDVMVRHPEDFQAGLDSNGGISPDLELKLAVSGEDEAFAGALSTFLKNGKDPGKNPDLSSDAASVEIT